MQNFKLIAQFEVQAALEEVVRNPWLWDAIKDRQEHPDSPHLDTKAIFLRWCEDQSPAAVFEDNPTINYPALKELPQTWALLARVCAQLQPKAVGRAMLTVLRRDGGAILRHVDEGAYAERYTRFHLPLATGEGCQFYGETASDCGEFVHMRKGELWWFDHRRPHWVFNGSTTHRLHLIVDLDMP